MSDDLSEIEKLRSELSELKAKLRMSKTDRDMINKYTSQLNKDMTSLQEKHSEVIKERDYYLTSIRDLKSIYDIEVSRLKHETDKLKQDNEQLKSFYTTLEEENREVKMELRNINFEHDVLQIDLYNEREKSSDLNNQLRDTRRKNRMLQSDINEADRVTTKTINRLIDRIGSYESDNNVLRNQLQIYEKELDIRGLLCFVCRVGIKTKKCDRCVEMFCDECFNHMEMCPFCRKEFSNSLSNVESNIMISRSQSRQVIPFPNTIFVPSTSNDVSTNVNNTNSNTPLHITNVLSNISPDNDFDSMV